MPDFAILKPHGLKVAVDFLTSRSALLALVAFSVIGAVVLDDYGVARNEPLQREFGHAAINYALGDDDALRSLPGPAHNRFYTTAFEAALALVERLLNLTDSRDIYLSRHLLTHLFFVVGGFFCALLTYRLFNSRWLALFALLLFVLHPRLYAHSFLNSKDVPFLAMFMIALHLIHRASRRDTAGAFALCGMGVGVLVNFRIMGVVLFAAVLALRACDLFVASGGQERKHILITVGAFTLAVGVTLYAVTPYLWRDPSEIVEAIAVLSRHPTHVTSLFQGDLVRWPEIPAHYLPVWIAISTPAVTLLLGLVGAASMLHQGLTHPGDMVRNTLARFGLLLLALLLAPALAVILVNSNIYATWRHMYFLYAPLCLLAVFGLRWLASVRIGPTLQRAVPILAVAGLTATVFEMASIHPYQNSYFNFLVDRSTAERLRNRYDIEYEGTAYREGLEYLLRRHPFSPIHLPYPLSTAGLPHFIREYYRVIERNMLILPEADRKRLAFADSAATAGDYFITNHHYSGLGALPGPMFAPSVYSRRIYNNSILTVTALDPSLVDAATEDAYRGLYQSTISGTPAARSNWDLYLDGNKLTWVREPCGPADVRHPFLLKVRPVDVNDLPWWNRKAGFIDMSFGFAEYGVRIDGTCMMRRPLPDYSIQRIDAGQWIPGGQELWRATITSLP